MSVPISKAYIERYYRHSDYELNEILSRQESMLEDVEKRIKVIKFILDARQKQEGEAQCKTS